MKKLDLDFLKEYVATPSPSGYEMRLGGQKVWIDYVKQYADKVETDGYGNAYAYYGSFFKNKSHDIKKPYTVLLDAHADEIGFYVFDITSKGFLKVKCIGGSDITITPSSRVDVWGDNGKIPGVFGHPAIHVHGRKFKQKSENVFVDLGVSSKKEVEDLGIHVGTPITMSDGYMELGDYYCGRSLDDKVGGFINAQVLKNLKKNNVELPFELVIANTVQEEVGLKGASMAAKLINPDVAIAIDVTHDTESPAYNKNKQGSLTAGKGVVIMTAPSLHNGVVDMLIDTASKNKIRFQRTASGASSGTNADAYAYPHGIPTGLLKMAMRYMHTTVETIHKKDVNSAIKLLLATLNNPRIIESFKY